MTKAVKHQSAQEYITGRTLDAGYGAHPSVIANDFYGIDMQQGEPPEGYKEVKSVDLNSEPIPYEDKFFHTVMAFDIVEHLMNPLSFFLEANRVLEKDGKFIFCIPNPYFWREIILNFFINRFIKRGETPFQEGHINLPTRHTARTMFYWSGFELEKEIGVSFPLPKTKFVMQIKSLPSIAYEIIYVARKIKDTPKFSIITKQRGVGWQRL